jgi:hypothetical protein
VSDATEALLARVRSEFEPVTELSETEHLAVTTTEPLAARVEAVRRAVES